MKFLIFPINAVKNPIKQGFSSRKNITIFCLLLLYLRGVFQGYIDNRRGRDDLWMIIILLSNNHNNII